MKRDAEHTVSVVIRKPVGVLIDSGHFPILPTTLDIDDELYLIIIMSFFIMSFL